MNIAICDDERVFSERLKELLERMASNLAEKYEIGLNKIDIYDDIDEFFSEFSNEENSISYDIICMDIDWEKVEGNGISYAARIYEILPKAQIIYITSYNDRYSQDIFMEKSNLCGLLIKPVDTVRLEKLLEKANKRIEEKRANILAVKVKGMVVSVPYEDILYLESDAHLIRIHLCSNANIEGMEEFESDICAYGKLDEYEKEMGKVFIRCHKSYLINLAYIKRMDRASVYLMNSEIIPISKRNTIAAREKFFNYMKAKM